MHVRTPHPLSGYISGLLGLAAVLCGLIVGPRNVLAEPAARPNTLTEAEVRDGWLLLFDGETTFGWKASTDANWAVSDGTLTVSSGKPGLLCTTSDFADFQLAVDFRAPVDTNSGIFLRTPPLPQNPNKDCYELNIDSSARAPFPTGSFVGRHRATVKAVDDQWHHYDVVARGGNFQVKLDGHDVLEYTDPRPLLRGRIGLQLNHGAVAFRNVKLKPLALQSIFNGRDLTGWKEYPGKSTRTSVTSGGALKLVNGPGQVETAGRYGDFILQLEANILTPGINSGVFFRCIPGDFQMGYECQIQNSFQNGDRTKPKDCGTGGIYRRQNARRVVADDQQWVALTVVADGNHMATWVNGFPVCDFTDQRKADPNPRRGTRLDAGTIILQAHDATTNVAFRGFRVAELPAPDAPTK